MRPFWGPKRLFQIPLHGSDFWVSAKFDRTTVFRLLVAPALAFVWPGLPVLLETGMQLANGAGNEICMLIHRCKQGANGIDLMAMVLPGLTFWILDLPSLF